MKPIAAFCIILLLSGMFSGCNNSTNTDTPLPYTENPQIISEPEAEMPDDFGFDINFGIYGKNNINSYNNTFTKDLVTAGSETIDFFISAEKMREIYEAFNEYEITELPDDINAEVKSDINENYMQWTPSDKYSLTYTCNNETRTIVCEDGGPWYADSGPPDSRNRLVAFVALISDYICGTEEYKQMPPAEGGYD